MAWKNAGWLDVVMWDIARVTLFICASKARKPAVKVRFREGSWKLNSVTNFQFFFAPVDIIFVPFFVELMISLN